MIDPVCGMKIEPDSAAAAWEHEGVTHYFCSVGCFELFRVEPKRYLDADAAPGEM